MQALNNRPARGLIPLLLVLLIISSSSAFAQGSIFGTVTNSDLSTPANGEISFYGYLDDTDEEIRIETAVGAGYDAGNWFDDFQNYLTEAPGNPYDYHFFNTTNSEGFILSKLIPNNSFQQENISLTTVAWPTATTGLTGRTISSNGVVVSWNGTSGLTYHVYRRLAGSNGSFFRIDDPSGLLTNPGVADSFFVDTSVDGISDYEYMVIAENGSGNLGQHSNTITVTSGIIEAPVVNAITPSSGFLAGGTAVTITGTGFDMAGATATLGGASISSLVVVSPFEMTGLTPPGTAGSADLFVTNSAAALASTPLVGAFTYVANNAPVVADIPNQTVAEGASFTTIALDDFVTDIDHLDSEISWSYAGNTDLSVSIDVNRIATIIAPSADWNGSEIITFTATDPGLLFSSDPATFTITAVNDAPVVADIPDQSVAEGALFATINLDSYVTDIDNLASEMSWTYSGNTALTVSIDVNRVATITAPTADWNGSEIITFTSTDPGLLFSSDPATFTVTAVNDAPIVADIPDQSVAEGALFTTINLDSYVTDIDNLASEMTWTYAGNTNLLVSIDVNRVATITAPTADWNGSEIITFTSTDPGLLFASDPATFTVTAVNDAPVTTDIPDQSIAEGGTFAIINLDDFVSDLDNLDSEMTWSYSGNTELTVVIDVNRVATITMPTTDWNGSETIIFTATDPGLLFASDPATFSVTAVNDAPILTDIPDQSIAEGATFATISLDSYVTDIDNLASEMTWTYAGNTALTVSIDVNRIATITIPTADWNGSEIITFTATDPGLLFASDPATFTVTGVNDGPIVTDIPDQTLAEGASFATINLDDFVSDLDNLDSEITWSYAGNIALTVSIDVNRVATITAPTADWNGSEIITFTATDPGLLFASDPATFTLTAVNDAPVVTDIPNQAIAEGGTFATINLDSYVTDVDNLASEMVWSYAGNTELTVSIDLNRVATITMPTVNWNGLETVTFTATDPGLLFSSDPASFTASASNDAPVVSDIPDQTIAEGATFTTINLDSYVTDIDNLPAEMTWSYAGNTNLLVSIDVNRIATITAPTLDWNGSEIITFTATDPGLLFASDPATFSITPVNDAPIVADIPGQAIAEGGTFTTIDLDSYVSDIDNLASEMIWSYSGNTELTVAIDINRIATITMPTTDWNGSETITFTATDPGLLFSSDVAGFSASASNDAPVLTAIGPLVVDENANLNVIITASDIDGTIPFLTAETLPLNATFVDNLDGTGTLDFNPDFTQSGIYNVTFIASDGILADSEVVAITVNEINQLPILAGIGPQIVDEGVNLNFVISASDPDGVIPVLTTSVLPANATFIDNLDGTGIFDFTPDFTQSGIINLSFYASDGTDTDSELVAITVNELGNQAPVLNPIGTHVVAETGNLNFIVTAADPDGTIPTLSASNIPVNATFLDNLDGTGVFDFSPDFTQSGDFLVTFKAFDGVLVDSEVVTISVTNANQLPIFSLIGPQVVTEGANLSFAVTATDADGVFPTLSTSALPANATFTDSLNGTGWFDFTPDFTQSGVINISFYASDGIDTDSELVAITVNEAGNQPPVIDSIGPRIVSEGATLIFPITASDADGTIPVLTAINVPLNATFVDNLDGSGSFDFLPDFTQSGLYSVTFIASDGVADDSEVVDITVNELGNQPPVLAPIGPQVINENDTLVVNLTATDPEGNSIFFSMTTNGIMPGISLVDNFDGTAVLTYTPDFLASGIDTVRIFAIDNGTPPVSASEDVEIITAEINQPPVIDSAGPFGVKVGKTLPFTIRATDSTADSSGMIFLTVTGLPNGATFSDNGDGTGDFSFTPDFSQVGQMTVRFTAIDNGKPQMTANMDVLITVVATNQPPVLASIPPQIVDEGQVLILNVSATDPEGVIPTLSASSIPTNASFIDNLDGTGTLTFSPTFIQAGLYGVVIEAYDGVDVDQATVLIQVSEAGNQNPNLFFIGPQQVIEAQTLTFDVGGDDPDSTVPSFIADSLPVGAFFEDYGDGTGAFIWTPDYTQSGNYNLYFMAFDGELADTEIVAIDVIDAGSQRPSLAAVLDVTVDELNLITFSVTTSDPDQVPPILTTSPLPGDATFIDNIDFSGSFSWQTTYEDEGVYSITFYATDSDSATFIDSATIQITINNVNRSPIFGFAGIQTRDVDEGGSLTYLVVASDADSILPLISMVPAIPNFVLTDSIVGNEKFGVLTITPDFTQAGDYWVTFIARDGDTLNYPEDSTFTVPATQFTVNEVPVAPILSPIGSFTVIEGGLTMFAVTGTHPGAIPFQIYAENVPTNAGLLGFGSTRTFQFLPDFTQAGVYDILFYVSDGSLADSEIVTITVTEAGNQAPIFVDNFPDTQLVVIGNSVTNHVTASDPDLDVLTLIMTSAPANVVFVDSGNGASTMVFTPDNTQTWGTFVFRYQADDPSGAADTLMKWIRVMPFMRGDTNGDEDVNVGDITFLVDFIFNHGETPPSLEAADSNFDGMVNVSDAIYLVNYIFKHGPPPGGGN